MVHSDRLQHIGILVPDAEQAACWYVEKAGFEKKATYFADGSKAVFVQSAAGVMCELIERPAGSAQAQEIQKNGARIDHIAYECDDLEAAFEAAKACEMNILEGIVDIPTFWDNGFRYFLTKTVSGEKVEFCKVL